MVDLILLVWMLDVGMVDLVIVVLIIVIGVLRGNVWLKVWFLWVYVMIVDDLVWGESGVYLFRCLWFVV